MPSTPGVYQYFNVDGKIIYVGKAKNLKRRVSSYFNKVHESAKTNILINNMKNPTPTHLRRRERVRFSRTLRLTPQTTPFGGKN